MGHIRTAVVAGLFAGCACAALKIGEQTLVKAYLGAAEVKKGFAGAAEVFNAHPDVLDGLTVWYKLDDDADSAAVANSAAGAPQGEATFDTRSRHIAGQIGGALNFWDGEASASNRVAMASASACVPYGAAPRTVAWWELRLAPDDLPWTGAQFSAWSLSDGPLASRLFPLNAWPGDTKRQLLAMGEGNLDWADGVTCNVWTHFAFTYDGSTVTLYRNGLNVGSVAAALDTANASDVISVGSGPVNDFYGALDDFRVYGRCLSADEVRQIVLAGGGTPEEAPPVPEAVTVYTSYGYPGEYDVQAYDGGWNPVALIFDDSQTFSTESPDNVVYLCVYDTAYGEVNYAELPCLLEVYWP